MATRIRMTSSKSGKRSQPPWLVLHPSPSKVELSGAMGLKGRGHCLTWVSWGVAVMESGPGKRGASQCRCSGSLAGRPSSSSPLLGAYPMAFQGATLQMH